LRNWFEPTISCWFRRSARLLDGAHIHHLVLDQNMSIIEGSLGVLPRRILSMRTTTARRARFLPMPGLPTNCGPMTDREPNHRGCISRRLVAACGNRNRVTAPATTPCCWPRRRRRGRAIGGRPGRGRRRRRPRACQTRRGQNWCWSRIDLGARGYRARHAAANAIPPISSCSMSRPSRFLRPPRASRPTASMSS